MNEYENQQSMKVYTIYCVNIKKEKKTSIHTKEVNHVHCAIMKHQEREKEKERESIISSRVGQNH